MKATAVIIKAGFVVLVVLYAGCGSSPPAVEIPQQAQAPDAPVCTRYAPAAIDILPLTGFIAPGPSGADSAIEVYVALLDAFGSPIKAPGSFRFELYVCAQRSAEPKGKRITIWPDMDLTDPVKNNDYWQDFFRAYRFELPVGQSQNQSYILQVTCVCSMRQRLSAELALRPER